MEVLLRTEPVTDHDYLVFCEAVEALGREEIVGFPLAGRFAWLCFDHGFLDFG